VVVALVIEGGQIEVAGQVWQRQEAPEQIHPVEGARSRQCSGVGSQTSHADKGGRRGHRR